MRFHLASLALLFVLSVASPVATSEDVSEANVLVKRQCGRFYLSSVSPAPILSESYND